MIFSIQECSLGFVLIAITDTGVRAIFFADSREELLQQAKDRLPNAKLVDASSHTLIHDTLQAIQHPRDTSDLPLDIQGTAFQKMVWQALLSIPSGKTCFYSDIAARINAPSAVRAVANACGQNPLAVLIPCHRVLRKDGSLGGYYWGLKRKQLLLEREKISESGRLL